MILLQFFRFFGFLVYAIMAGYILYKNPKSLLNRTCALIISSFAIWTIADPDSLGKDFTKETVILFQNIASLGWISFASFFVCFAMAFSKREKLLKKKRVLVLIFILPVILLYKQWTVGLNSFPVLEDFGWYFRWKDSFWTYLYYVYYISFVLISLYLIYLHGIKTKQITEKKQSKIVVAAVIISLIGATITDVIMPSLDIHVIPQIGKFVLFVFGGGIIYAILKYDFLTVSFAIAAENIISTMEELLILADVEGKIINVNSAVIDSLKYEQKELTGQSVAILFSENSLITSFLGRISTEEIVKSYETKLLAKDACEIPVIISGSTLKDKQGDVRGMVLIATDIAERKRVEEILRESEEKYSFLVQNSQDIIFTINLDGIFTYVSPAWTFLLGQPICDVLGKSFQQFVHPDDVLKCMLLIQEIFETGQSQNDIMYRVQHIDGSWRWHSSHGARLMNEKGEIVGFHGVGRDITVRKQIEEALEESERLLRESQEIAGLGSFTWNISKGVWTSSSILDRIFGIDESYIRSLKGWLATIHPDFRKTIQNDVANNVFGKQQKFDKEYKIINQKNNQVLWVHGLGQLELDNNHQPTKVIGTIQDITERKQAEEEIKHKNEQLLKLNTEKDKFFSIIAHDLRGPFSGFFGLTQIMAEELHSLTIDQIQVFSLRMKDSASNLYHLLENLLHWSRMQQGLFPFEPKEMELSPIMNVSIDNVLESAKNKGIEITSDIPNKTKVFADENMLQTIIRNLVSNAVKFTPKGGFIRVSAKTTGDKNIEIAIKDTGIGMNQAMVDNLFRLDVQTSRKGTEGEPSTGLGLLLCSEFIEKHGGKIWVESTEGVGSTFYFTFPSMS